MGAQQSTEQQYGGQYETRYTTSEPRYERYESSQTTTTSSQRRPDDHQFDHYEVDANMQTPAMQRTLSTTSRILRDEPSSPTETIRGEMHELNSRLADFLADIGALEASKYRLEGELKNERQTQEMMIQDLKEKAEREVHSLRALGDQLQGELRDAQRALKQEKASTAGKLNAAHRSHVEEISEIRADYERRHASEIEIIRQQAEAHSARTHSRLVAEVDSLQRRLANALEENEKSRRVTRQDPDLLTQINRLRNENASLQHQLGSIADKYAEQQAELETRISETLVEVQRKNDLLITRDLQLSELQGSQELLLREVRMYRKLLDTEVPRITPSKKRKVTTSTTTITTSTSPTSTGVATINVSPNSTGGTSDPPTPRSFSRSKSIEMTIQDGHSFLEDGDGPVRIEEFRPKEERVVLVNTSADVAEIGGWRLVAEKSKKEFKIPPGKTIGAGEMLTVWSGKQNEDRDFDDNDLWWSPRSMWASRGEHAVLIDHKGTVVSKCS